MHRDLKPGNVLFDYTTKEVFIIDWGLASFYNPRRSFFLIILRTAQQCACEYSQLQRPRAAPQRRGMLSPSARPVVLQLLSRYVVLRLHCGRHGLQSASFLPRPRQ